MPAVNNMASQKFPHTFLWWVILVPTNYAQLLLYIYYEQSDLYMLVTTNALAVATTRAQVIMNRLQLEIIQQYSQILQS